MTEGTSEQNIQSRMTEARQDAMNKLIEAGAGRILTRLSRNCIAIRVSTTAAPKVRQLKDAEIHLEGVLMKDAEVKNPQLILVPRHVDTELSRIANEARNCPRRYGVPFVSVAYLVPTISADSDQEPPVVAMFRQLREISERYQKTADDLYPLYEERKHELEKLSIYPRIEKHLLDRDAWVKQHTIEHTTFPLPGLPMEYSQMVSDTIMEDSRMAGITRDQAQLIGRISDNIASEATATSTRHGLENSAEWVQMVQQSAAKMAAQAAESLVSGPVNELLALMESFESILRRNGTVRSDSLFNLRAAYEKVRGFSFFLPQSYREMMTQLDRRLAETDQREISGAANASRADDLARYLSGVRESLQQAEDSGLALGEFRMAIELN